jgi:hypothetical protein
MQHLIAADAAFSRAEAVYGLFFVPFITDIRSP